MRPVLVYDGNCGFCRTWVEYWKQLTGDAVAYEPTFDSPESVRLKMPDGSVLEGARAVFRSLDARVLLWIYRSVPGFAAASEGAYRAIAAHRSFFQRITVLLFGPRVERLHYRTVEWLFVKALAVIWLIAFVSFGVQARGLIGSHGVLPAGRYLARVAQYFGGDAWRVAPSVFWLGAGDGMIVGVCVAGAACALLALAGVLRRAALFGAFVLYLSLVSVSQEFLSYQWDVLLLEAGFLAVFLGWSRVVVWLFRWLLFRLTFLSGAVKLLSGDPTWRHLDALRFHYWTQPIPTPVAWYAAKLPGWFQRASCFAVLAVELAVPFLALGPRRVRRFAAPWLIGLQCLILLTGNYAFFNWLTIALCVFLVDDEWLARLRLRRAFDGRDRRWAVWPVAALILILSGLQLVQALGGGLPGPAKALLAAASPFSLTSTYGLFATMTTARTEIVIEGSDDAATWRAYEFPYKPGSVDRAPPWVAPYQPRLDWQMWFAALGSYRENPWFLNLLARILQGEPEVLRLLKGNPFPGHPPKYVRAPAYDYHFAERGAWWTRRLLGLYVPVISLESFRLNSDRGAGTERWAAPRRGSAESVHRTGECCRPIPYASRDLSWFDPDL